MMTDTTDKRWWHFDTRLIAMLAVALILLTGFAMIASEVLEGEVFGFDHAIITALRTTADSSVPIGPAWLRTAMIDITALGGVTVLTIVTTVVVCFFLIGRKPHMALFVALAVIAGTSLSFLLKAIFARPRPDVVAHLVEEHSMSFPSGHALMSAVVYLTLGAMLARGQKSHAVRLYLLTVALFLTLTIGASRVWLGVHWPSDVLAGWALGATWALAMSLIAGWLQREHIVEPAVGDATSTQMASSSRT